MPVERAEGTEAASARPEADRHTHSRPARRRPPRAGKVLEAQAAPPAPPAQAEAQVLERLCAPRGRPARLAKVQQRGQQAAAGRWSVEEEAVWGRGGEARGLVRAVGACRLWSGAARGAARLRHMHRVPAPSPCPCLTVAPAAAAHRSRPAQSARAPAWEQHGRWAKRSEHGCSMLGRRRGVRCQVSGARCQHDGARGVWVQ